MKNEVFSTFGTVVILFASARGGPRRARRRQGQGGRAVAANRLRARQAMLDARSLAMLVVSPKAAGLASARASGAIKLAGIAKSFGETRVLRGIDLDIRAGEFITILGPSGCGKSTLLRIIAGLERQSGGTVAIDGRSVDALPPDRRDIAMVFQSYAL